jgi:hypothetical protein
VTIGGETFGAFVGGYGSALIGTAVVATALHKPGDLIEQDIVSFAGGVVLSYLFVMPFGSALGAWGAGTTMRQNGNFWTALAGGALGMPVGAGCAILAQNIPYGGGANPLRLVCYAVALTAQPVGAVIGYNLGRPRDAEYGWLQRHMDVPRMAMTVSHDELNQPVAGVKCDLLAARF